MSNFGVIITGTLDPGIAELVRSLRQRGFLTFASCSGGAGHAYPDPTVRMHAEPEGANATAARLDMVLQELGYADYVVSVCRVSDSDVGFVEVEFWAYETLPEPWWRRWLWRLCSALAGRQRNVVRRNNGQVEVVVG